MAERLLPRPNRDVDGLEDNRRGTVPSSKGWNQRWSSPMMKMQSGRLPRAMNNCVKKRPARGTLLREPLQLPHMAAGFDRALGSGYGSSPPVSAVQWQMLLRHSLTSAAFGQLRAVTVAEIVIYSGEMALSAFSVFLHRRDTHTPTDSVIGPEQSTHRCSICASAKNRRFMSRSSLHRRRSRLETDMSTRREALFYMTP